MSEFAIDSAVGLLDVSERSVADGIDVARSFLIGFFLFLPSRFTEQAEQLCRIGLQNIDPLLSMLNVDFSIYIGLKNWDEDISEHMCQKVIELGPNTIFESEFSCETGKDVQPDVLHHAIRISRDPDGQNGVT